MAVQAKAAVSGTIATVTPEQAAEWLATVNTNNRRLRDKRVMVYRSEMENGRWRFTGDSIKFDANGILLDGQHRLAACVEAGVPFTTLVVRGLESEVFNVLDRNLGRTASDALEHDGVKHSVTAAAAARLVIAFNAGTIVNSNYTNTLATPELVLNEVTGHAADYERACKLGRSARKSGFNQAAFVAFVILADRKYGSWTVDQFIDNVFTGADLSQGDPRIPLRQQMISPARPKGALGCLALIIRAWNAWNRGESRRMIKGWTRTMPFPQFDESA